MKLINQSVTLYGAKRTTLQMIKDIPVVIKRLGKRKFEDRDRVSETDLIDHIVMAWKISEDEAKKLIVVGKRDGLLYCPTPSTLAVTG